MQIPGENLSGYSYLDYVTAMGEDELLAQLRQIKMPFRILHMYSIGNKHIAWLSLSNKLTKKEVETKVTKPKVTKPKK